MAALSRIEALACWSGPVTIEPLGGGLSRTVHRVTDKGHRFFVRAPASRQPHPVDIDAELAATRAAGRLGIAPRLLHAEAGFMVLDWVEGRTLAPSDLRRKDIQRRLAGLLALCRRDLPAHYDGPAVDRTPAAVLADYRSRLAAAPAPLRDAARALAVAGELAVAALAEVPRGFVHGDVHAANLIDDGNRLWLVDWEYSGIGLPVVDWASACLNGLLDEASMAAALDRWEASGGVRPTPRAFAGALAAAAMRDLLWGYAQRAFGDRDVDNSYIAINEARVAARLAALATTQ